MKWLLDLLKILGLSALVALVILWFTSSIYVGCNALDAFYGEPQIVLWLEFLNKLAIAAALWLLGLVVYFLLRRKRNVNWLIYFTVLTAVLVFTFIVPGGEQVAQENKKITLAICNKSSDDGMELQMLDLNKEEYNFVNRKKHWLPSIPAEAQAITVDYIRDDLFGEFDLKVRFKLPAGTELDSLNYPQWSKSGSTYVFRQIQH